MTSKSMTSENAQKISLISEVMRLLVTPKCSLYSFSPFDFSSTQYEFPDKYFYLSIVLNKEGVPGNMRSHIFMIFSQKLIINKQI